MAARCCQCGRTLTRPKATPTDRPDLASLTTAELYAYYKRIAPREDLAFFPQGG